MTKRYWFKNYRCPNVLCFAVIEAESIMQAYARFHAHTGIDPTSYGIACITRSFL